ncbi:putative isoaspartyl peptidase/L-asparaginase 2 [Platysternon megacephalum]|uniref:Putative isoaspartyl peptidase/L-asparaginase 2 n=1 Tax=Platysternon megacephalum TaxID=55544 RepID=A0A4D9DBQ8_9SAUR|nr:putative isoaspartyl peptidase/L-asparaginase 2 [Platysternon megacephalum]
MQKHIDANQSLFKVIDFGKTYTGKFPLRAYCITADAASNCKQGELKPAKGRFFLMTQTHAREIATSEMALSFVNDLMRKAGSNDADVKNLLDTTEIWVLPAANPDGQEYVSSSGEPNMQRKNRNPSYGRCTGVTVGVDLNRNLDSRWGTTGVSKNPCGDTFPGPKANSEVETQAIIKLWQQLFPDQRGPSESDKVAANGTGYMLSIHSVAALNLFPWQGVNRKAPNDAELRAIMTTASSMNGYAAGQAPELLYSASGGHDDWIYDKLGVATGTIELGSNDDECGNGNFHPKYSCMALYEQQNLPVLYYLAKIAKSPYALGTSGYVQSASLATSTLSTTVANAPRNAIVETSFTADFASIEQVKLARANNKGVSVTTSKLSFGSKPADAKVMYLRTKNTTTGAYGPITVVSLNK